MANTCLDKTVYEAALERVNFVFDNCDDIIVSMSGGKDSTVIYHLAHKVAAERGRLPLKVFWLDQEAEWQATEDYMRSIMYRDDVVPCWFQIPFRLTNSLSFKDNFLYCWDKSKEDVWIRQQDAIGIKENPLPERDRFKSLISLLPSTCDCSGKEHVGVLVGMRAEENTVRRMAMMHAKSQYKGITWCRKTEKNTRVFWPIYDFSANDVWTCIAKNGLPYNRIYDAFYKFGIPKNAMRVSALIHETAWHSIERLQEAEPRMYNRYLARINGVNCFNHFRNEIMPYVLPPYFDSWLEYRDYLLVNLIEPKYHAIFKQRWSRPGQNTDNWYKTHVREIMVNDIDGTTNDNYRSKSRLDDYRLPGGKYDKRSIERMKNERP